MGSAPLPSTPSQEVGQNGGIYGEQAPGRRGPEPDDLPPAQLLGLGQNLRERGRAAGCRAFFPGDCVRERSQATLLWGPAVMCTVWIWGEEPSPHFMEIPVDPVL